MATLDKKQPAACPWIPSTVPHPPQPVTEPAATTPQGPQLPSSAKATSAAPVFSYWADTVHITPPITSASGPWNEQLKQEKEYSATLPDQSGGSYSLTGKTGDGVSGSIAHTPRADSDGTQTSSSTSAAMKDGKLNVTTGQATTTQDGENTAKTTDKVGVRSDGTVSAGTSTTTGTGKDGPSTTTGGGMSVGPNGQLGFNGNASYNNGNGQTYSADGQISVGPNGTTASGSLGYEGENSSASVSASVGPDQTTLGAQVKAGDVKLGASYETLYGHTTENAVTKDDGGDAYRLLAGNYLGTTRQDQTKLSGSVGMGGVGASGGIYSGSTLSLLSQLPPDFDKLPKAEQEKITQHQRDELAKLGGFSDVKLADLQNGSGVQFTTYNGWNASAGLSYGGLGVSGGVNQSSASQVTIVKDQLGMIQVSMLRQDALGTEAGASALSVGLNTTDKSANIHQFQFQVDPKNPEAMASMEQFMKTGLLPGADKLQGKDQQKAAANFGNALKDVDSLSKGIADLQKIPQDQLTPDQRNQLVDMQTQLGDAQRTLDINRNYLNDQWKDQMSVGESPIPGVQLKLQTDTKQDSQGMSASVPVLGNVDIFSSQQTWVHQQAVNAQNGVDNLFGYNQKDYIFGHLADEHAANTTSNPNGTVFAMYSDNRIWDNQDDVKSILHRDLPDYVLDAWGGDIRGRTTVALNQQQLDGMAGYLNDMKNPKSEAMWKDFGSRAALFMNGGDYWLTNDLTNSFQVAGYQGSRSNFLQGLSDPNSANGKLFAQLPGAASDPQTTMTQLSQKFSTIQSPADFQKLSPVEQQLFVQVLGKTSGPEGDLTGSRNSFESMAAISLIKDPNVRAQQLCGLYDEANNQAQDAGKDAVWQFSKFSERFKDDPATYNLVQQAISFHWVQDDVDKLSKDSNQDQLTQQMKDAYNHETYWLLRGNVHDPDEQKALQVLQAANQQGGAKEMDAVLQQSGANPVELLQCLKDDPVRQHLYYDLLMQTSYASQLSGVELNFKP